MAQQALNYQQLLNLAVAENASTPDPGLTGVLAWSTTINAAVSWNGSNWNAVGAAGGGSKTLSRLRARDNYPPASGFATLDTRNSILVLAFIDNAIEAACFVDVMPEGASLGSGVKVRIHWIAATATSGNVRWGAAFERSNTDLDSDSFDTETQANGAANGTSGIVTVTEITVTDLDGITAGDLFRLRVRRIGDDGTNDTMSGDAQLLMVELRSAA